MPEDTGKVLHVLTGCTAVGKTELALKWAELNGAEIVSCDSLLFYRQMDIGTAKPTREELARVPHHLIDICELTERMDITRYISLARSCVEDIHARGHSILVTGGSGFYLKSFFAPVADDVEVDAILREKVAALSLEQALVELRSLNPEGLGTLDLANPRRVTRALERCLASGKTLLNLKNDFSAQPSAFADWKIKLVQLDRSPADLADRITLRVEMMLRAGLIEEVRRLVLLGLLDNPSAARAIGYREIIDMLQGTLPKEKVLSEIIQNTRALVKKQRTWFRTQLPAHTVIDAATASASALFASA